MKVVVGLGNPGFQYKKTRHNVGFMVIDELSEKLNVKVKQKKFHSLIGESSIHGEKLILVKPQTFMNESGVAVRPLLDYFKVSIDDLAVIYDDLDLPAGKIRLRQKGGSGGHNGIKSLISHLGTKDFNRIRIGIDRPPQEKLVVDYVLKPFAKKEKKIISDACDKASEACLKWAQVPYVEVMNEFNI